MCTPPIYCLLPWVGCTRVCPRQRSRKRAQQLEKRNNSRYFEIWKKYVKYVFSNTAGADRFGRFAALTGVPMTAMRARPTSVATGRGAGRHRTLIVDRCVLVSITVRPTQCRRRALSIDSSSRRAVLAK